MGVAICEAAAVLLIGGRFPTDGGGGEGGGGDGDGDGDGDDDDEEGRLALSAAAAADGGPSPAAAAAASALEGLVPLLVTVGAADRLPNVRIRAARAIEVRQRPVRE